MRRPLRSTLRHLLFASATASACTSMHPVTAPVPEPLPSGMQREVRLSLRSGATVSMFEARLKGDSVVGYDRPPSQASAVRVAVPTAEIREIAVRKEDKFKTVLAVTAGTFAAITLIAALACASSVSG